MNKILKLELLICLALSLFVVFSSITEFSTLNYVEFPKIVQIILIIFGVVILSLIKDSKTRIGKFDLLSIGTYILLLLLIISRGYIAPDLNIDYYFDSPVKRIMYFSYYSYIIIFPLIILVSYIMTIYVKNISLKKEQN